MKRGWYITVVAGLASFFTVAPLSVIFEPRAWLLSAAAMLIGVMVAVAVIARALHAPRWLQPLVMAAALLAYLTHRFGADLELYGVIPTSRVVGRFQELINVAGHDTMEVAVPVPDRPALQFVTLLGIGGMTLLVDFLAVTLRRPALAGLPMLAVYAVPVALLQVNVPILPTILAVCGYLWLLVADHTDQMRGWGRRIDAEGRAIDPWEASPIAAAGRRIALVGLLVAITIPIFLPGQSTGLLDRFATIGAIGESGIEGGRSGGDTVVNPITMLRGNLVRNEIVNMVRVTTDDPNPDYLRIAVADEIGPDGFRASTPMSTQPLSDLQDSTPSLPVTQKEQSTNVNITNLDTFYLPLYLHSTNVDKGRLRGAWVYDPIANVALSPSRSNVRSSRYTVTYRDFSFTAAELRQAPALDPSSVPALLFSEVPAIPYVTEWVDRTVANKETQYDQVMAILESLSARNGFQYSLSTQAGTSGELIVDFLDNKKGYCEQYAAAMTWLVRAAGYPARVATGFTQGSRDPNDSRTWVMTNMNLHAWVEVYFTGYGWVTFDPTPSSSVPGAVALPWAPDPSRPESASGSDAAAGAPEALGAQAPAPGDARLLDVNSAPSAAPKPKAAVSPTRYAPWILLTLVLVALIPAGARILTRRRRLAHIDNAALAGAADRAHAAWAEFTDLLVDYRIRSDASETPRSLVTRITAESTKGDGESHRTLRESAVESARLLATAEERARYARVPHQETGLSAALTTVRSELRAGSGWGITLVAALTPPSTIGRWQGEIMDVTHSCSEWLGRIQRLWATRRASNDTTS